MIEKILDYYFRIPIIIDVLLASIIILIFYILECKGIYCYSFKFTNKDLTSSISEVCLTTSGFILTFMTLIITFKNSNENSTSKFYNSQYYFLTVKHLKNSVKILVIISLVGFLLLNFLMKSNLRLLFYYNIFSIILIFLTLWRSLLIFSKIIKIQSE